MMESDDNDSRPGTRVGMRILRISALMAGVYIFFHLLPDFAPERPASYLRQITGDPSPELCDFSSIGFTAVNQTRSPIVMRLLAHSTPRAGEEVRMTVALGRPGGRPITFSDLEEKHTEKFHLLIIDPALRDYHHKHPVPTGVPGEYEFSFRPESSGSYRFFAEVVPVVTGRPIQGVADMEVEGGEAATPERALSMATTIGEYEFILIAQEAPRARRPGVLSFDVRHVVEGEPVRLEPVMGAWAHIVAFDKARSGFAHMHPLQEGLEIDLDAIKPELDFMFYATEAGPHTIWAQVKIDGEEIFAPFRVEVL